ncbi:hypothetical protein [Azospirillum largimobile]
MILRLALKEAEPQFRAAVSQMLHFERLAEGWIESVRKILEKLPGASARDLDLFVAGFSEFVRYSQSDLVPWIDRANRELADIERRTPQYRATVGEVWRRIKNACEGVLAQTRDALAAGGAEKAVRFPETFSSTLPEGKKEQDDLDQLAAQVYKYFADRAFGVDCEVGAEDLGDERLYFVKVLVCADVEKPHRQFAEQEDHIQRLVEEIKPELFGRAHLRYMRGADAA